MVSHTSTGDELGIGTLAEPDDETVAVEEPGLFSGDALFGRTPPRTPSNPSRGDLSDALVGDAGAKTSATTSTARRGGRLRRLRGRLRPLRRADARPVDHAGVGIALQSVLAVALGAGLFLAFAQLWQWNSLIAMVLSILATLGLVAGVWWCRTEDIASTLIAVGVGLLVTFGPLALMHATN